MGKPMMLQPDDDRRIEGLKQRMGARTKVQVVRSALDALEAHVARRERIERWQRAARLVAKSSHEVLRTYQPHGGVRLSRHD